MANKNPKHRRNREERARNKKAKRENRSLGPKNSDKRKLA